MPSKPLIRVKGLSFQYDQVPILEKVSFDIHEGEFVGIIGPNGSGKTTLLKLLLGLLENQSGKIEFLGKQVQVGKYDSQLAYIPQKVTQHDSRFPITVEEVVRLGRVKPRGLLQFFGPADHHQVTRALRQVGMEEFRHRLVTDLSGGQQQRVFISKALVNTPKILILDEPTVGVDVESQDQFYRLLAELHKKHGLTIVIVSHDIDVVMNEVDTVLCLNKTLVYHGSPKEFVKKDYLEKLYGKGRRWIIHAH